MPDVSRRAFLIRSSLGVAAAGALTVPGVQALLGTAEADAPAMDASAADSAAVADTGTAAMSEPLVAHITDLQTGEMSLYMGEREVVVRDPAMAARLFQAAR